MCINKVPPPGLAPPLDYLVIYICLDNEYSDDDLYESIYEVIRPRNSDRDPEVSTFNNL